MSSRMFTAVLAAAGVLALPGSASADTSEGSCIPTWELTNFQPASPTFTQTVKSSSYFSRPAVIILLSAS